MSARDTLIGILRQWTDSHDAAPETPEALLAASDAELLREWSAKIREAGTAKGWSTWAAAFLDPDTEFVDTGMPSTETIVAELRRLDRVTILRAEARNLRKVEREDTPQGALGTRTGLLRAALILDERADMLEEKDTTGGDQPREGESTHAPAEPYSYTDPQNHRLMFLTATDALSKPYVWVQADNLAIGGENVNVWLPLGQAHALDRALNAGCAFEFTDHTGDTLAAEPGPIWTPFTVTRNADAEPPAAVRVVVLTARLPKLRAGIRAAADRIAGEPSRATDATGGADQ